jgi:acetyl-CoA carboxylase biotin carboxyl carrier protein
VELKQIKELMAAMGKSCTKRLVIKKEGFELELERETSAVCRTSESMEFVDEQAFRNDLSQKRASAALLRANEIPSSLVSSAVETPKDDANAIYVTSPMVGTFYSTPSPEDPAFIKTGDKIDKNTVVCIIEAMKVMNEVKAGVAGTIQEVLVENGHPVEFGTKLFRVIP